MKTMTFNNDKNQKHEKRIGWRIFVGFCAVAIALLLTIDIEPAHAADGVTIVVTYANGTEATKNISVGALRGYSATKKTLDGEAEGETVEVSGPTVGQILKSNKVTNYGSISPFNENDIIVVKKGGRDCDPLLWTEGVTNVAELSDVDGAGIETSTIVNPIKFKSGPSCTPQSPKEGDTIKISYSLDIDAFYKSSNEYDEGSDTGISWSASGAGKINLSDTITSGTGAQSLSGTITKTGSITITPSSQKFDAASGKITITGTTTTKPPTTASPTTQKGTTKKGGSDDDDKSLDNAIIIADQSKLKKKTYKNSELKKLIKVRLNGEYVKKKYWDVVYNKYDKTTDKLVIKIEGKNGYTGGTRQAIYFSSTTTTDNVLMASVTAKGKKKLQFTWTKVPGASGYDIFLAKCKDGEYKCICKKVKTIKGNGKCKWKKSGLDKKTAYHGYVKAFVMKNGKKQYIKTSPVVHAFTSGGTENYTNAKSVRVKKSKVTLTKGKTFKIKASVKKLKKSKKLMSKKHAPKLRYMSSNSGVAVACTCGKVTAVGKGTCYIYAFAHNGKYKRIKVTVR